MGVDTVPNQNSTPIRACVVGANAPYNHGLPLAGVTIPLQGGRDWEIIYDTVISTITPA